MKLVRLISVVVVMVMMAACAPVGSDNTEPEDPPDGGDTTPTTEAADTATTEAGETTPDTEAGDEGEDVVLQMAGNEYAYTEATIEAFEEANPGVTIEYAGGRIPFEEGIPQSMLRSGEGPDVLLANSGPGRVGQLAEAGLIVDLTDLYEELDLESQYQQFMINQLEAQGDGRFYEIVEGVDVFQVHYNMEYFDEAGIEPPSTWEEFLSNCEALAESGVDPMVLGARGNFAGGWLFGNLLEASAGQDYMTEVIYGDASFDTPESIRAAEMLQQLVDGACLDGATAAAMDFAQMESAFLSGQAAMVVAPQRVLVDAERNGTDISQFGSFVIPSRDDDRPSTPSAGPADSWVVNADSDHPEEALAWIEFVTSEEYLQIAIEEGLSLTPVRQVPDGTDLPQPIQSALDRLGDGAGYNPSVYLPGEGTQAWYEAMQNLVTGSMSAEEAIAHVEEALQEAG